MLIDSNILVYAINSSSPKHKQAQAFLQENIDNLEIAHQNIFKTVRVLTHPKFSNPMEISNAFEAIENIIDVCTVISPDYRTHQIALELIKKYNLVSDLVFDAYLVATAISNDIEKLATDNVKDLESFSEISLINPFS